jgi:zinc D-Ala-D-Ala carboxypeptidase
MATVTSSRYFSTAELACSHCGFAYMDEHFMELLDGLRVNFGPITLTSAYRCPEHPIEKAKSSGPGAHSTGKAVDIAVSRGDAYRLLSLVFQEDYDVRSFTGVGINQKGNSRFIHLDTITEGVRPTVWSY